jgi:hypothetical protein
LDQNYAIPPFERQRPASFVFRNLMKTVILEWGQLKDGDGMDFCHTVMGAAFANIAALDKHWKRRVKGLPTPNELATTYSGQELDQMVVDIELWLRKE